MLISDGSGPKSTGPGRARALKVGLEPFHKFRARALTGLQILLNKKLKFSVPFPKVKLGPSRALGPSSKVGLRAFLKTQVPGRA